MTAKVRMKPPTFAVNVTQQRGQWAQSNIASQVMATVHPSSILRAPDDDSRHEEMRKFVEDLKTVAGQLRHRRAA
jgi:uracil-DNA glycosylase